MSGPPTQPAVPPRIAATPDTAAMAAGQAPLAPPPPAPPAQLQQPPVHASMPPRRSSASTDCNVDYFSHPWTESDLSQSWSAVTKRKRTHVDGVRLENASWRKWMQQRLNLPRIRPETLRWKKDEDITWLYGPYFRAGITAVDNRGVRDVDLTAELLAMARRSSGSGGGGGQPSASSQRPVEERRRHRHDQQQHDQQEQQQQQQQEQRGYKRLHRRRHIRTGSAPCLVHHDHWSTVSRPAGDHQSPPPPPPPTSSLQQPQFIPPRNSDLAPAAFSTGRALKSALKRVDKASTTSELRKFQQATTQRLAALQFITSTTDSVDSAVGRQRSATPSAMSVGSVDASPSSSPLGAAAGLPVFNSLACTASTTNTTTGLDVALASMNITVNAALCTNGNNATSTIDSSTGMQHMQHIQQQEQQQVYMMDRRMNRLRFNSQVEVLEYDKAERLLGIASPSPTLPSPPYRASSSASSQSSPTGRTHPPDAPAVQKSVAAPAAQTPDSDTRPPSLCADSSSESLVGPPPLPITPHHLASPSSSSSSSLPATSTSSDASTTATTATGAITPPGNVACASTGGQAAGDSNGGVNVAGGNAGGGGGGGWFSAVYELSSAAASLIRQGGFF